MKKSMICLLIPFLLMMFSSEAGAQVKLNLKEKLNKEMNKKIEEGVEGIFNKNDTTANKGEASNEANAGSGSGQPGETGGQKVTARNSADALTLNWSSYDFVPGDKIIFEDNLVGEENGEFPSRWDLVRGNTEIALFGGENVIMMRDGAPSIVPYIENSNSDYLPEVFTIELDLYYPGDGYFEIYLYDRKNQKSNSPTGYTYIQVQEDQFILGQARSRHPDESLSKSRWMHISIAYTSGKLKAYMDETRLINIPRLDFNPSGLTLYTYHARNDNRYYIKNVRIAEGGVKYYDRFLQDGKIVSNGIRFDVGKATLRPESMGVINEIYRMLSEHPDVNVSIEGHTDSDGETDLNQKLSEERAETVMNQLVSMGIPAGRLTSKGLGESMPVNTNSTPEGKAENRRVEFVKSY